AFFVLDSKSCHDHKNVVRTPDFKDRLAAASAAKKAQIERALAIAEDPARLSRIKARSEIIAARNIRIAERERVRRESIARQAAERAAAEAAEAVGFFFAASFTKSSAPAETASASSTFSGGTSFKCSPNLCSSACSSSRDP